MRSLLSDVYLHADTNLRRPTKASFTSLSSRLGEVVSELHLKLASLLSSPASSRHLEFLLALLRLAKTLGDNSPYNRMTRPLAQPLASAVLPLLKARGKWLYDARRGHRSHTSLLQILNAPSLQRARLPPSRRTLSVSP